jgi:hypothetical protein
VGHRKDEILDTLARAANVAQFVSFGPDLVQRHARLRGFPPDHRFASPEEAVGVLLDRTPERSVNVRSYDPDAPKSREFLYGRTDASEVVRELRRLAASGLWTIVNETIDVRDGGVSGVAFGNLLEFAPGDTPRCVEKPGTAALPRALGLRLLETVYGFRPGLPERSELRVEFTIHPLRRGNRHEHTVLWEIEEPGPPPDGAVLPAWPNHFSRHLGDKAFGLLIADAYGLPVPRTLVIPRGLAPFTFGADTGSAETWIRTCPREQVPGLFTTQRGWADPFALLNKEDPEGTALASVLSQQAVEARWSGALLTSPAGEPLVEGVAGTGDDFMTGRRPPEDLPAEVLAAVRVTFERARDLLGPVRFEWAWDGRTVWVLQLHRGASAAAGRVIVPGEAPHYHRFEVSRGIESLRELITQIQGAGDGIALVGRVGVTSHLGDLLRRARIPSRIEEG